MCNMEERLKAYLTKTSELVVGLSKKDESMTMDKPIASHKPLLAQTYSSPVPLRKDHTVL